MSKTNRATPTPAADSVGDDRHPVGGLVTHGGDRGSERLESGGAAGDSQEPGVVLDGEATAEPAWWEVDKTKPGSRGRTTGATALRKAHDLALVADLVRTHRGDTEAVRTHCATALGWTESRWRTISREVCRLFTFAAKEAAVAHAIGKPITEVGKSALIAPRRVVVTKTVRTVHRPPLKGDT